jgi:hypothetical protein
MSIFDEAIREHLELKRQHGADEPELRKLEDEAFGPPARPGTEAAVEAPLPQDLIEAPGEAPTELVGAEDQATAIADEGEPGVIEEDEIVVPEPDTEDVPLPAEEEHPAMEHAVEPAADSSEQAVADQPTELYELEDEPQEPEAEALAEPPEDEYFSEQSLSDELDKALDAPGSAPPPVEGSEPAEQKEGEPEEGEDVLEETPEFLQDTPEHDRLWFEQKPPKDFDFDE